MLIFTWPFRRKVKRELPLLHVHTFKTGERLYTYRVSDYGKISSRYYRVIQELLKAIAAFGMLPNQWKAACQMVKEVHIKTLKGQFDPVEASTDTIQSMDWFLNKFDSYGSMDEEYYLSLFNMFFVLEEEKETGYQERFNDRKRELLDLEPETRDFFLTKLKKDLQGSILGSLESMKRVSEAVMVEARQMEKQWNPRNITSSTRSRKKI